MADKKKRRVVKKTTETVRERAAKQTAGETEKPRHIRNTARKAGSPFRVIAKFGQRILKPFGFLLIPFKTKPARAIGRFLSKVLFINYVRNSWREVRLVTWPDRRNTVKLTFAVFVFAVLFATLIAVVDYGLDKVFKAILLG